MGDLAAAKANLRELKAEREKVAAERARTRMVLPTLEPVVRAIPGRPDRGHGDAAA